MLTVAEVTVIVPRSHTAPPSAFPPLAPTVPELPDPPFPPVTLLFVNVQLRIDKVPVLSLNTAPPCAAPPLPPGPSCVLLVNVLPAAPVALLPEKVQRVSDKLPVLKMA